MTEPVLTKPLHVAIIMDGNGRWATKQEQPRLFGHTHGVEAVKCIVRACPDLGVGTVTLFAFAIANWKRDKEEVDGLWEIFHTFFHNDIAELIDGGVRVRVIGRRDGLPEKVLAEIEKAEADSGENDTFLLQVALNYDGIDEVTRLIERVVSDGVKATDITPEFVVTHLDTEPNNDPDIVIRTGMDAAHDGMSIWRSSAFLPLQSVQSVCVSSEVLWPDFTPEHLEKIIAYAKPEARLFGGQRKTT